MPTDPDIDRARAEEARDRLNAYRRGEIEVMTLEEVIASLTKKVTVRFLKVAQVPSFVFGAPPCP